MLFDLIGFQGFANWYAELGKLKIFWAKPVKSINLLVKEGNLYFVGVEWIVRSIIRDAIICIAEKQYETPKIIRLLRDYGDSVKILIIPEESPIDLSLVNARSILYFWNVDAKTLEPNRHTRMKVYSE
jgi:hypothetical protein